MKKSLQLFFLVLLSSIVLISCKKDEEPVKRRPSSGGSGSIVQDSIKYVIPAKAYPGLEVTIVGEAFNTENPDSNIVLFNEYGAKVIRVTPDSLTVIVPTYSKPGTITVKVNGVQRANTLAFSHYVFPEPIISNICNTGDRALKTSDFEIYKLEKNSSNAGDYEYYSFWFRFTVTNTGSKDADLINYLLQGWISTDTKKGNDNAAGGASQSTSIILPGESKQFLRTGNSGQKDYLDIDGKYFLLDVNYENEGCIDLIAQKFVLK